MTRFVSDEYRRGQPCMATLPIRPKLFIQTGLGEVRIIEYLHHREINR